MESRVTYIDMQRNDYIPREIKLISSKGYVEPANPEIRNTALRIMGDNGPYSINQIDSIYRYMLDNWYYESDPSTSDLIRYANETLILGEERNSSGSGDCEDFSILLSSLIESIGGTTRIIIVKNNSEGFAHAYTEVYLGKSNNSQVEDATHWLKLKYNADKIYKEIDKESNDVWLNLDWGLYSLREAHPGGPFRPGDEHLIIYSGSNTLNKLVPITSSSSYIEPYKGTYLGPPDNEDTNKKETNKKEANKKETNK